MAPEDLAWQAMPHLCEIGGRLKVARRLLLEIIGAGKEQTHLGRENPGPQKKTAGQLYPLVCITAATALVDPIYSNAFVSCHFSLR